MTPFLLVNKPKGITSHDAVDRVRAVVGERRVGHGGTLDPLAEGLLVIGIGRASTAKLSRFLKEPKTYEAEVVLGRTSTTDDAEGELTVRSERVPSKKEIALALERFKGRISQTPPQYSAIKQKGQRAYAMARAGKAVELGPRPVTVYGLELVSYTYPRLTVRLAVSSGFYVRSFARDLGSALGVGGYLSKLVRSAIGAYTLSEAVALSQLTPATWQDHAFELGEP